LPDLPLVEPDPPAVRFHRLQQAEAHRAERVGEQDQPARRQVGLEDPAEVRVQRLAVEDVRTDDPIVALGVIPRRPVRRAVGDGLGAVPLAVAPAELQRQLVAIGLHDPAAERRGDDARDPHAGAKFQDAPTRDLARAGGDLVDERDGRGPEGDPIRQADVRLADDARLILSGQDRAGVEHRPLATALAEAVILQRERPRGGVEYRAVGFAHRNPCS
jgi:hypothetical protein